MSLYHPVQIGPLSLPGNLFLAPVAGYTDRAFRSVCIDAGADFTYTELVSSEALVRSGAEPSRALASPAQLLARRAQNEARYAVQLFGAEQDVMYRAALLLAPHHPEAVDLNAGCPVPKVVKSGAGSALMKNPLLLGRIVEALVRASQKALGGAPVTVKLRSGWDGASLNYGECARIAVEAGAALVCLHPRTRAQGYGGKADWSLIGELAAHLEVPVAGSGDLYRPEDAERLLRETGCAAVMFARGALGNPFIFGAAKSLLCGGRWEPPSPQARIRAALGQLDLLAEDRGEAAACREMRKQFCAYTRGLAGAAALRNQLVHAETIADYHALLL